MISTILCDLDGVVWLAHRPIAGSTDAIAALQAAGRRILFVTNNSAATVATQEAALAAIGVDATGSVVSSAMAAALLVEPGERVLVAGGPGLVEAMHARGVEVVVNDGTLDEAAIEANPFAAVVTGLHRDFDYARLASAARAIHRGARLIGTNGDPTYPMPNGFDPGGGSILAAIATAGLVEPIVAGKPRRPMASLIASMLTTPTSPYDPGTVLMVGDRMDTDGSFAIELGCRFALVRSGSTAPGAGVDGLPPDALDVADLRAVASAVLAVDD
jgi:HAD superfamily hydrolase (TIGR01450 family)